MGVGLGGPLGETTDRICPVPDRCGVPREEGAAVLAVERDQPYSETLLVSSEHSVSRREWKAWPPPAEVFGRGSPRELPKGGRVLDAKEEGAGSRQSEGEHLAWDLPGSLQCLLLTLLLGTWELSPLCFIKSETS